MDAEALQAQIDLSNSIAYDLVSSWVKPSTTSATSISHTISRELEEYAKRPPRLGLGATVSQSSLATSREAARLKGKLVGQKRRRDQSDDHGGAMSARRPNISEDYGDEDESRSAAISTKKSRMNRSLGTGSSLKVPTDISIDASDQTLPITFSITHQTSPVVKSEPSSSLELAHLPVPSQSASVLNLHGPPLVQDEHPQVDGVTPKKKRRRRRGKGRKSVGGAEAV